MAIVLQENTYETQNLHFLLGQSMGVINLLIIKYPELKEDLELMLEHLNKISKLCYPPYSIKVFEKTEK